MIQQNLAVLEIYLESAEKRGMDKMHQSSYSFKVYLCISELCTTEQCVRQDSNNWSIKGQ